MHWHYRRNPQLWGFLVAFAKSRWYEDHHVQVAYPFLPLCHL